MLPTHHSVSSCRKSAHPFLPGFLTVCVYVVLGLFLTVLVLTNLPVLALLFTFLGAMSITSSTVRVGSAARCAQLTGRDMIIAPVNYGLGFRGRIA